MDGDGKIHAAYLALSAALRLRVSLVREQGRVDSLTLVFLDAALVDLDQSFRTLIEAIEDCDAVPFDPLT